MSIFNKIFGEAREPNYHQILLKHNSYFQGLDITEKNRFISRLKKFLAVMEFRAAKGMQVDDEMRVIIGSAFIMITFGLDKFVLTEYNRIFIAPRSYSYRSQDQLMSGDINTEIKLISLSWPCVLKGFQIDNDALNIAIHEFAHCLRIESFSSRFFKIFIDREDWKKWEVEATAQMKELRKGKSSVIHEYAAQNMMEFFAVCLETFFEKPASFSKELPHLYHQLCSLLNQNPLNTGHPVIAQNF